MRHIRTLFVLLLTIATATLLEVGVSNVPPLGKLLDPFSGFWQNASTGKMDLSAVCLASGLQEEVVVRFDENQVPHIEAKNDVDLAFAQGYITAFHRLWQMDFQTRAAAGRIAEIIGERALGFDRLQRRKGNAQAAQRAYDNFSKDPVMGPLVEAYTAGINAYISSLNYKRLPLEYKLLRYKPEPWSCMKVAFMMVQMIDELAGGDKTIEHTKALHCLGRNTFDLLYPDRLDKDDQPVIPLQTPWAFKAPLIEQPPLDLPACADWKQTAKQPQGGSNNWAIRAEKTRTRVPYLANDPHLLMQLPSIWYVAHLKSPTVNVFGATIPGLPGVVIGCNESFAWGVTNAARQVKTWYQIDFEDNHKKQYRYDNLWLKTQTVVEPIRVRGQQTFYDQVVYTHYGPVVYDETFPRAGANHLAMKWMGHSPGNELRTFYLLNRAQTIEEGRKALDHYHVAGQNFAMASRENHIAMQVAGLFPLQFQQQGKFVMRGNSTRYEWQGVIPQAHNPSVCDPPQHYVSSANQRSTDRSYPYAYHHYDEEHYRNRRLNQALKTIQKADETSMMALQTDNKNLAAQENLPWLLTHIDASKLDKAQALAYKLLCDWDFCNDVESLAPSVFSLWQERIEGKLWASLHEQGVVPPDFFHTMTLLRTSERCPLWELKTAHQRSALLESTFFEAVAALQQWKSEHPSSDGRWGDYRNVFLHHIARIPAFGVAHVQVGGGKGILNANEAGRGASMRLVVALEQNPKGWFAYPGGQSGNPGSPYYLNLLETWRKGQYFAISAHMPSDNASTVVRMRPST